MAKKKDAAAYDPANEPNDTPTPAEDASVAVAEPDQQEASVAEDTKDDADGASSEQEESEASIAETPSTVADTVEGEFRLPPGPLADAFSLLHDAVTAMAELPPPHPDDRVEQSIRDTGRVLTREQGETLDVLFRYAESVHAPVQSRGRTIPCHLKAHVPRYMVDRFTELLEAARAEEDPA